MSRKSAWFAAPRAHAIGSMTPIGTPMKSVSTRRASPASTTSSMGNWNRSRSARSVATTSDALDDSPLPSGTSDRIDGVEAPDAMPGGAQHRASRPARSRPRLPLRASSPTTNRACCWSCGIDALHARDAASALAATATAVVCGITVGSTKPPE